MNIEGIKVDDEWEWYLSQLYFKLLENLPKPKVAVELAPGFRYKIALALADIGFDGTLFVIDANKDVADYIEYKYKQILPNAKIECICNTFEKAFDVLPQNIDIFLANHVIDDLMLESYVNKSYYNQLLSNNMDRKRYLSVWNNFSQDKKSIQEITNEINKTFMKFFNEKNVGKVILSQYRSNLFYQGQDECIEKIVRKTFDNLKAFFCFDDWAKEALTFHPFGDDERYLGKELLENTQNIDNWIVGSPKKEVIMKKRIVLASNNEHKIREFRQMFSEYEIYALNDIGFYEDIIEDGETFFDNSLIKAKTIRNYLLEKGLHAIVIADDSGLCVDALNGQPGVYSARYASEHDSKKNRQKLLQEMNGKEKRSAYFQCTLIKMEMDGTYKVFEGKTYGQILNEERGDTSFGYDAVFFSDDLQKSFGEATAEEKNAVSHRGRAIELMKKDLN